MTVYDLFVKHTENNCTLVAEFLYQRSSLRRDKKSEILTQAMADKAAVVANEFHDFSIRFFKDTAAALTVPKPDKPVPISMTTCPQCGSVHCRGGFMYFSED